MPEPTVKIDCLFDLTDVEIAVAARKRATVETEMFKLESAFGLEKDKHKTALGKLEATAGALAELIRKGYEMRPTECRLDWDYTAKEVRTVRLDTGGVVNSRTMSDFEIGKGPRLPFDPPIALADSDPDVVAAKAAENTDATAPGAGEADAPADAQAMGEAAAEPTPAGEAASPVESEQQRKPRSDKGKARGPRKAHEPDARDPGFEAHPAATEAAPAEAEPELPPAKTLAPTAGELLLILPIMDPAFSRVLVIATDAELSAVANSEKAQRIPHLAVAVKRELRRRAGAEQLRPPAHLPRGRGRRLHSAGLRLRRAVRQGRRFRGSRPRGAGGTLPRLLGLRLQGLHRIEHTKRHLPRVRTPDGLSPRPRRRDGPARTWPRQWVGHKP
jgi:hypothetical protein